MYLICVCYYYEYFNANNKYTLMSIEPFVDHEPLPIMAPHLQDEVWFHGSITRQHAEALLKHVS